MMVFGNCGLSLLTSLSLTGSNIFGTMGILDMGSSSDCGLIIATGQEVQGDN